MKKKKKSVIEVPKSITFAANLLGKLAPNLGAKYGVYFFSKPIQFKRPDREKPCHEEAIKGGLILDNGKKITTYQWGKGSKKILCVHGWNGRASQFHTIIKSLKSEDYTIYAFDAPGHGDSPKNLTSMIDFIAATFVMQRKFGDFHAVIGHSLGAMAGINAVSRGLKANCIVSIAAGDVIEDIFEDFRRKMKVSEKMKRRMKKRFEDNYKINADDYDVHKNAQKIEQPILVVQDKNDREVPLYKAENIAKHAKNGKLFVTERLGHHRILSNAKTIQHITDFIGG